jgi:hypothetical protein
MERKRERKLLREQKKKRNQDRHKRQVDSKSEGGPGLKVFVKPGQTKKAAKKVAPRGITCEVVLGVGVHSIGNLPRSRSILQLHLCQVPPTMMIGLSKNWSKGWGSNHLPEDKARTCAFIVSDAIAVWQGRFHKNNANISCKHVLFRKKEERNDVVQARQGI